MGSECWWGKMGTRAWTWTGCHVFSAVMNENKESSTVLKLYPCLVCLFFGAENGIWVAFSLILNPRVFIFLCVATEASGLYCYSFCVNPWSCCLFIIRPPYCEDAHSIFKVSTTQSLSRHLNHSTCWILHTQQIWKKAFCFNCLTLLTHVLPFISFS